MTVTFGDVAVVVDIGECRRLTRPAADLASILLGDPKLDDRPAARTGHLVPCRCRATRTTIRTGGPDIAAAIKRIRTVFLSHTARAYGWC
jgi:hypothetical protein